MGQVFKLWDKMGQFIKKWDLWDGWEDCDNLLFNNDIVNEFVCTKDDVK